MYTIGSPETTNENRISVVTNNATPFPIYTFTPEIAEKGSMLVNYTCVDATGSGIMRTKLLHWKKTNTGVLTVPTPTAYPSPTGDIGMTTPDFTAVAVGGNVEIRVTGIANKDVRHSIILEIYNSAVLDR